MSNRHVSRRRFLGTTAGAAAVGATAPLFLPKLYAEEAASERLNVAAIGVGGRGTGIAQEAARLGRMVACCDVHSRHAENFQNWVKEEQGGECNAYEDYRELLDKEKDVDAVTIGTPDHWHVKIAIDAMKAGKHVYCEKPLTLTIDEGRQINEAVAKYDRIFQVGTQQRSEFGGAFLKAVAIAQSGRLGDQLEAISSVGTAASRSDDPDKPFGPFEPSPVPSRLNWDLWLGQAPEVPFTSERFGWNFRWWFEYSGGQVTDWGVHHTDIAFWALAGADGQAIEAEGTGEFMAVERPLVRDFLVGKLPPQEMPNGYNVAHSFDVDVRLSTGNKIKIISGTNELLISGQRGRIRVNRGGLTGRPVEEIDADPKAREEIEQRMAELYGGELPKQHLPHMQNFFDCIRSGRQPVANVPDHVRAVNACHLANIALVTGRKVTFDPATQSFPGDDEANALVGREQRAEYAIEV